jgi:hypothetical protein
MRSRKSDAEAVADLARFMISDKRKGFSLIEAACYRRSRTPSPDDFAITIAAAGDLIATLRELVREDAMPITPKAEPETQRRSRRRRDRQLDLFE